MFVGLLGVLLSQNSPTVVAPTGYARKTVDPLVLNFEAVARAV